MLFNLQIITQQSKNRPDNQDCSLVIVVKYSQLLLILFTGTILQIVVNNYLQDQP